MGTYPWRAMACRGMQSVAQSPSRTPRAVRSRPGTIEKQCETPERLASLIKPEVALARVLLTYSSCRPCIQQVAMERQDHSRAASARGVRGSLACHARSAALCILMLIGTFPDPIRHIAVT